MKEKYIEDLKEIKEIMNRSSRFISLSGLSGVSAGISALIGATVAYLTVYREQDLLTYDIIQPGSEQLINLLLIAGGTLFLAISTGIFFTTRETKKRNLKIWDAQSKRMLINLSLPLLTGGLLCFILIFKGYIGIVIPLTLIFYGLALINASKYTLSELRSLGLLEIALGLIAVQYIELALYFWAVGFGVLHIVYGLIMHRRYRL